MEGAGFKSIVIFLLLAVLAFTVGSLASESATAALVPVALLMGLFFLIYLGQRSWVLVFLAPPVCSAVGISLFQNFPIGYFLCGAVLVYLIMLSMLGYVKLQWNRFPLLDIMALILALYFLSTWVRHPVVLGSLWQFVDFGDMDIGGQDYVWCISGVVAYISLSLIPVKLPDLLKVMKIAFWLSFLLVVVQSFRHYGIGIAMEAAENSRFTGYMSVGGTLFNFLVAKYSFCGILMSPWKFLLLGVSLMATALSGFRSAISGNVVFLLVAAVFYRQFIVTVVFGLALWGGTIYLVQEGMFDNAPYGVKRILSDVPGVEFNDERETRDAEGSSEWRYVMWKWALDPSTGYIKDYVWGDGFALSYKEERMRQLAVSYRLSAEGNQRHFAQRGLWHNAAIVILHRIGMVGLALVFIWMYTLSYIAVKVGRKLRAVEGYEYIYIPLITIVVDTLLFVIIPGTCAFVFNAYYTAALLKIVRNSLNQDKGNAETSSSRRYVPMMLRA